MSQIMKTFLGVFLIMFMVVTSSGVLSGFMTVVEAQNLHAQIINELEDSDYDSSVAQTCFENASKAGDTLELKLYMTDNSIRTVTDASQIASSDEIEKARVELKFTYAVAFFGIEQEHVLSGYALWYFSCGYGCIRGEKQMELLIEELGGSVIMLLLGSGVIGVLVYVSTLL